MHKLLPYEAEALIPEFPQVLGKCQLTCESAILECTAIVDEPIMIPFWFI